MKNVRNKRSWVWALGVAGAIAFVPHVSFAFVTSDDEQFRAELAEAKARAADFSKTMDRIENETKNLEAAGPEQKRLEEEEAAEHEKARKEYVRERDQSPSEDVERERLEHADDLEKEKENEEMEAARRSYVQKRDRVRELLERDAAIDEEREYGL